MKKLYTSIMVVLLPSVLYLVFFFLNDPHGYFGNTKSDSNELIDNMLDFKNENYDAIILGDSKLNAFDEARVLELNRETGYKYKKMAYRGAMTTEMNTLFWWCMDTKPDSIKSVIVETSWYNMNVLLQQDRVASTIEQIKNPLNYAFSINNMSDMFTAVFMNKDTNGSGKEKKITKEQKTINFDTHIKGMELYLENYQTDYDALNGLISICQYCNDNNIEIKIVTSPWWDDYFFRLKNYGLYTEFDDYKISLSKYADIYDMEYDECLLCKRYEDFSDYAHFHGETYDDFCKMIIYDDREFARLWQKGKIIKEQ